MKTGIILFTYNRSEHLQKVVDGLEKNKGISKLYIFQDGLKCEEHRSGWEKTRQIIDAIDWCEVVPHYETYNKGLSRSIVDGINVVLEENDTVVVLEDDCVPAPCFIKFMEQCFEKYKGDQRVYSVGGYSWPINIQKKDECDIYFCRRITSWGWGTWKDRWEKYEQDYTFLQRMKFDQKLSEELAIWGNDLERMVVDRVKGFNDSWAVFWALKTIEDEGFCINPYTSLIENIGLDGSGVHCGKTDFYKVDLNLCVKEKFSFPKDIRILKETENAFAKLYGCYTAIKYEQTVERDQILVYGLGNCFFENEEIINKNYNILAFIDKNRKGFYAGKKIIKAKEITEYDFDKILVAIKNDEERIKVAHSLVDEYQVSADKIVFERN